MDKDNTQQACFNCARPETESPLISLRFAERSLWICPQCMPVLIHNTGELSAKLNSAAGNKA